MVNRQRLGRLDLTTSPGNTEPIGRAFGLDWINGHRWGIAHPDHAYYADPHCVRFGSRFVSLYPNPWPRVVDGRTYLWRSGEIRTAREFRYGVLDVEFMLPWGSNLWPAIWMYGAYWPPEIDIVEGWSSKRRWYMPDHGQFRYSLLRDNVCPGIHLASDNQESRQGGWPLRGYVMHGILDPHDLNRARMVKTPDELEISYNGVRVLHLTARRHADTLRRLNATPMNIILSLQVCNEFSLEDYYLAPRRDLLITHLQWNDL